MQRGKIFPLNNCNFCTTYSTSVENLFIYSLFFALNFFDQNFEMSAQRNIIKADLFAY